MAVVEHGVCQRRRIDAEKEHVDDNIAGAQKRWRVFLVLGSVEQASVVNGAADVIQLTKVIVHAVAVDGEVAGVVDVTIPKGKNNPEGYKDAKEAVERAVERDHEGVGRVPKQNVPVKGRERVDAEAMVDASDDIEIAVVRSNP